MTVDTDAPETDGRDRFVCVTAVPATLDGLLLGFDTDIISDAFLYIKDMFAMTSLVEGIVVSGALAGTALDAALGGYLVNRWGRRRLILISAAIFFVGSLVMAIAPTVGVLVVERLIDGVAIGFTSTVDPPYLSEIVPPKIRGLLVSLSQFAITAGILSLYLVNYTFADDGQWRWVPDTGMVPVVILAVGTVLVLENPRWLVEHGRESKACGIFSRTRTDDQIRAEPAEINGTIEAEDGDLLNLLESWMRPVLIVGVDLAALQQVTDINTVIYYVPTILESTDLESSASILVTVGIDVVSVVIIIVAVILIDRRGRRPLLSVGSVGMTFTPAVLGAAFYLPGFSGFVGTVATGSLMLYVAFFAIDLGPVLWLPIPEIYPLRIRGTVIGVVMVFNWVANLAISLVFPVMVVEVTITGTFWMFAALNAVAFAFTYRFVSEMKGRSLEATKSDLQENVLGGSPDRSSAGAVSDDD